MTTPLRHCFHSAAWFYALVTGPLSGTGERVELELPEHSKGASLVQFASAVGRPSPEPPLPEDAAPQQGQPRIEVLKITIMNDFHRDVIEAGMGTLLRTPGFTANMRLVCTDDASLRWCRDTIAHPSHCVRSRGTFGASDFQKNDYTKLVWLKWHVCLQALQWPNVSSVFFLDADVGVFAPFEEHLDARGADFMFSRELPGNLSAGLNGGQLWFKSNGRTLAYIRKVLQHDGVADPLDQVFAQKALRAPLSWRALPTEHFKSYCWTLNSLAAGIVTNSTLTYHANCHGKAASKAKTLLAARAKWLQARSPSQEGDSKSSNRSLP